jgi:FAD-linked sulfhydryl oxidase
MLSLLHSLPTLYPCSSCADDLGVYIRKNPPEQAVEAGRTALEKWLCEVHNDVNVKLGKEEFVCADVGERWRDGWKDGRCD